MSPDTELILTEPRGLRGDVTDALQRIAALETDNHAVLGNGQPGRMTKAEEAIQKLQQWRWWVVGAAAGMSGVVLILAWIVRG